MSTIARCLARAEVGGEQGRQNVGGKQECIWPEKIHPAVQGAPTCFMSSKCKCMMERAAIKMSWRLLSSGRFKLRLGGSTT